MRNENLLGIDLGGTAIKFGLFKQTGEILQKKSIPTPSNDYEKTLNLIAQTINEITDLKNIKAVGIGVPGFVIRDGFIANLPNVGWTNVDLKKDLEKILQVKVFVDNDANLAAAGEMWQGAGRDANNLLMVTVGTGVGGGVIINKEILHGKDNLAGEIGHLPINPKHGKRCNCGKIGCLETESSATAIKSYYLERSNNSRQDITVKEIFELADHGDRIAQEGIDNAAYYLGLALAQITQVNAFDKILIGGGVAAAREKFVEPVRRSFQQNVIKLLQDTPVVTAELGNDAGIVGAAWLALSKTNN